MLNLYDFPFNKPKKSQKQENYEIKAEWNNY